jgi:hypothetical protein
MSQPTRRDIVKFEGQPKPLFVRMVNLETGLLVREEGRIFPQVVAGVARGWADGDSGPRGRCTRCTSCTAADNFCLLVTNREISEANAWDFSGEVIVTRIDPKD